MQHGSLWRSLGSGSAAHRSSTSHAPAPVAVALTLHLKQPWEAAKASRGLGRAACSEAWAKRGMCSRLSVRAAHQEVSGAPSRPKQGPIRSFKSSDYGYTPYNRAKFGARNQSNVRAPPAGVPRWVQELAAHLAQLLADATPGQPIDPQLAAQVLQLLPPIHVNQAGRNGPRGASASESVLKREGSENEEESDGEEGLPVDIEVSDSEDDAAPSSVYDNELRAIMKHFNARGGDDDPNGGTRVRQEAAAAKQNGADAAKAHSGTETNGNADNASQGVLHDGSFFALLHSISDQGGPGAALAFRNIVHSQCPPLRATTTSPRVILLLINALLSGSNPEAAHAVFLQAATAEARAGAEGEEWTPCWAALSRAARPDLVAEIFRGMKAAGVEPGTQAYTCLMRARGYNPDSGSAGAAAAVEAFFEMKRQGVPRSPVFMAALASAVGFRLGVKGAMEILDYAEEESRNLSESSMHSTWGEMLGCSLSPDAPKELRPLLIKRMKQGGHRLECKHLTGIIARVGYTLPMEVYSLFKELKSKSLLKGLPLQIPMHRPDLFPIPPRKHQRTPSTFVPSIASLPSPKTQQSPYHATTNAGSSSDDGRPQVDPHADAALEMYTFLVTVVHRTRQSRDVQDIFAMMHADGVAPNEPILSRLCGAVAHGKDAAAAYRLYCYIVESGGELDMFMYRHIIAALISTAEARVWWPVTLRILHRMHMAIPMAMETDVQTSLVVAAGRGGWHAELLELYKLMLQDAVLPGTITFNAFITGALRSGRPRLGFAFGDAMVSMGCPPDEGTFSALLTCCTALKDVAAAQRYWALMHEHGVRPDRIACSSYMWSCLSGGRYDLVTQFYEDWQRSSRPPGTSKDAMSPPSYHELCQWLAKARRWTKLRIALDLQRFMRSQKLDPGKLTLEDIQKRAETDDPTGQWAQAAAVVSKVASRNEGTMAPSAAAMSFAVTAYASMGNVARAREVAELMSRTEMGDDRMAYATCLDACGGAGGATAASRLLIRAHDAGLRLDSSAYTSAIAACLPDGRVDLASQVLEVMKDGGVAANIITLNCALAVCVAAGDTARALIIFKGLESVWGATPNTITYATVAEGLAKAGRWGDAIKFIVIGEALGQARLPLMGPGRSEAECAPGLRAACMTTPPGISIDLHGMSVMAARAAVRGWLAVLRQAAFSGELAREPQPEHHGIVTGQGRNSKDGASKLRPAIEEILSGALGPAVAYSTQPWNQGALLIRAEDMLQWVKNPELDLGLGGSVEEKKLAELIRDPSPTAAILAEVD